MNNPAAILYIQDDRERTGLKMPLMLMDMIACPVLCWTTQALERLGVNRFFLVCDGELTSEAWKCFPSGAMVTAAEPYCYMDKLRMFLQDETELVVVTKPAVVLSVLLDFLRDYEAKPVRLGRDTGMYIAAPSDLLQGIEGDFYDHMSNAEQISAGMYGVIPIVKPADIALYQSDVQKDLLLCLVDDGVGIWDLSNLYVSPEARVAAGASLLPGTVLRGRTEIGAGCVIGPNSLIEDSQIGENTRVNSSQVYQSRIGTDTTVGPFAYVRPGSMIGDRVKVGDFVEVKNSVIGDGTKISHLTYVGDSDLGRDINLGCGTVTVNYDGVNKFRTVIEDGAFIGCNTNLIAPVKVGKGAYTAAGSTITGDVPADALAVARNRQENKDGWVLKKRKK